MCMYFFLLVIKRKFDTVILFVESLNLFFVFLNFPTISEAF